MKTFNHMKERFTEVMSGNWQEALITAAAWCGVVILGVVMLLTVV